MVFFLFIWKEMAWKIPNLENLEFYTKPLVGTTMQNFNYGLQRELMGAKWLHSGREYNETQWITLYCMRMDVLQNYLVQFLKCLADEFWQPEISRCKQSCNFLDHQIVTSCIGMVNVVFFLFIWNEMTWQIPNLENLEFYTCTLWDHNANLLIMAYRGNSWVPNNSNLIGINETKWITFDFMRNDVLQNYLVQFLKCLADNFDNLKFQDASKVTIFRPPK